MVFSGRLDLCYSTYRFINYKNQSMFIVKSLQKIVLLFLFIVSLFSFASLGAFSVYAQITPGAENFQPIGPVGVTSELEAAQDTVWNSILGEKGASSGPVGQILEGGGDVVLSGIMSIDDQEVLYIGVDADEFDEKADSLKQAFIKEMPNIPVYIEPTSGVQSNNNAPEETQSKESPASSAGEETALPALSFSKSPNTSIPDNTGTQGTRSSIAVSSSARIASMSVAVNITHTYIGDLKVDLVAPNGSTILLHNRTGGNTDNLSSTYTTELAGLAGQPASGTWTLRVGDYAGSDIGVLKSWRLTITPQTTSPTPPTSGTTIFSDDFASGLGKWNTSSGRSWGTSTLDDRVAISGKTLSNIVAEAEGCATPCTMTLKTPLNLTRYNSAYLSFHRFADNALDNGEYLKVEIGKNGVYTELDRWTPEENDNDDKWHYETYNLSRHLSTARSFTIRFTSKQNSVAEEVAVDNIMISTAAPSSPTSPTQKKCGNGPDKSTPLAGGDRVIPRTNTSTTPISCGTITLGGLETQNGEKGFLTAAHVVDQSTPGFDNDGVWAGHRKSGAVTLTPLGRVSIMPFTWDFVVSGTTKRSGGNTVLADAAFVEYPQASCAKRWSPYCFEYNYTETVRSKRILNLSGSNTYTTSSTYRVDGSQTPYRGLPVRSVGATTRVERVGSITTGKMLWSPTVRNIRTYVYHFTETPLGEAGDSGSPVYTVPNANNYVKLVGIYIGETTLGGQSYSVLSSWDDVKETLNLKSL